MNAGRELDALIAEKVMHLKQLDNSQLFEAFPTRGFCPPPYYSTDISAAWEVVEKVSSSWLVKSPWENVFQIHFTNGHYGNFEIILKLDNGDVVSQWVCGETAPHAICLASLKIIGHDIEK